MKKKCTYIKIIELNEIKCTYIKIIELNKIKCTYIKIIELNKISSIIGEVNKTVFFFHKHHKHLKRK